ncbi:hypothetical protein [Ahniella affigens]|uniref:hypothetical protein n=1 Tax=Ahniella affigens TaxID=2021234 RepID=UPI00147494CA|nr:hypothetical protein [Ahniella affigens]
MLCLRALSANNFIVWGSIVLGTIDTLVASVLAAIFATVFCVSKARNLAGTEEVDRLIQDTHQIREF